jgi:uncharacterized protein (TIGR00156 family)
MSFRAFVLSAALSVSALCIPAASAQYVGPSTSPAYRSVADVLKNPVDDAPVALEGYIIKKVGKKKYLFSDGVSEIRVEIEHRQFPPTPIDEKTRVQLRGEIEKDFLQSPEIDVDYLVIVK